MNKARKMQIICTLLAVFGCFGMGMHLFVQDGISHPTHMLTVFAILTKIGLFGNLAAALWRLAIEEKQTKHSEE